MSRNGDPAATATSSDKVRHTAEHPCPVCEGCDQDQRGEGKRCHGFTSKDGQWIHCSREDHAHGCRYHDGSRTYSHQAKGRCQCGTEHGTPEPKPRRKREGTFDRSCRYIDLEGKVRHETVRFKEPKGFAQCHSGPDGKTIWNLKGIETILYRLPELASANPARIVWIAEGEKDVDRLLALKEIATTNPMGSLKWRDENGKRYSETLRGRYCGILADNDDVGRKHAQEVARSLHGIAASVKIVELTGLPEEGDVSDFLDAGGTVEQLHRLAEQTPEWSDAPPTLKIADRVCEPEGDTGDTFSNCTETTDKDGKLDYKALSADEIAARIRDKTGGWPKRVGEQLFVQSHDYRPIFLEKPSQFFAFLDSIGKLFWLGGPRFVTQERFFEFDRKFPEERYDAIETLPHYPEVPRAYYMHPKVVPRTGGTLLDQLLDFFRPATDEDRELIRAMILTPFWGGPSGKRPAFKIEGPEQDPESGRGTGKTTLATTVSNLASGMIRLEPDEEFPRFITRLLSNEHGHKRLVLIDNVKRTRFSWAALEEFITTPTISGHALFRGEAQRPNNFTVIITMNGGSLSKDLTQRIIPIRLDRPAYSPQWDERLSGFIEKHRWDLIAEIIGTLADEQGVLSTVTRWATWEQEVLGQCDRVGDCQRVIAERSALSDDDADDAFEFEVFVAEMLSRRRHNSATEVIKIPTATIAEWLSIHENGAKGKPIKPNTASTILKNKPLKRLANTRTTTERFWVWRGKQSDAAIDPKDATDLRGPARAMWESDSASGN